MARQADSVPAENNSSIDGSADESLPPVVMQVLPRLDPGGVERGTVEISRALAAAGWGVVVVSEGGAMVRQLDRAGITHEVLPLSSKNPWVMRRNADRLAALIERYGVHIVHARSRAPAWSAYFAARRTGRHFVTTFHAAYGRENFLKRFYNSVMAKGERVIANSDYIAEHLRTYYQVGPDRLRVVHRGIDMDQFDPTKVSAERVIKLATEWRLPDGVPIVMLPGRPTRRKGATVLIQAMADLGRDDVLCLLVGGSEGRDAYRQELEDLARRLELEGVVRMVGPCHDMAAAYMLADVVVSPAILPEAFGRVAAEAQAMGRPVVATDLGGSREVLIENETGWLARPGDAGSLARALTKALGLKPPARERMAARARQHIASRFTVDRMCRQTLEAYVEVLTGP